MGLRISGLGARRVWSRGFYVPSTGRFAPPVHRTCPFFFTARRMEKSSADDAKYRGRLLKVRSKLARLLDRVTEYRNEVARGPLTAARLTELRAEVATIRTDDVPTRTKNLESVRKGLGDRATATDTSDLNECARLLEEVQTVARAVDEQLAVATAATAGTKRRAEGAVSRAKKPRTERAAPAMLADQRGVAYTPTEYEERVRNAKELVDALDAPALAVTDATIADSGSGARIARAVDLLADIAGYALANPVQRDAWYPGDPPRFGMQNTDFVAALRTVSNVAGAAFTRHFMLATGDELLLIYILAETPMGGGVAEYPELAPGLFKLAEMSTWLESVSTRMDLSSALRALAHAHSALAALGDSNNKPDTAKARAGLKPDILGDRGLRAQEAVRNLLALMLLRQFAQHSHALWTYARAKGLRQADGVADRAASELMVAMLEAERATPGAFDPAAITHAAWQLPDDSGTFIPPLLWHWRAWTAEALLASLPVLAQSLGRDLAPLEADLRAAQLGGPSKKKKKEPEPTPAPEPSPAGEPPMGGTATGAKRAPRKQLAGSERLNSPFPLSSLVIDGSRMRAGERVLFDHAFLTPAAVPAAALGAPTTGYNRISLVALGQVGFLHHLNTTLFDRRGATLALRGTSLLAVPAPWAELYPLVLAPDSFTLRALKKIEIAHPVDTPRAAQVMRVKLLKTIELNNLDNTTSWADPASVFALDYSMPSAAPAPSPATAPTLPVPTPAEPGPEGEGASATSVLVHVHVPADDVANMEHFRTHNQRTLPGGVALTIEIKVEAPMGEAAKRAERKPRGAKAEHAAGERALDEYEAASGLVFGETLEVPRVAPEVEPSTEATEAIHAFARAGFRGRLGEFLARHGEQWFDLSQEIDGDWSPDEEDASEFVHAIREAMAEMRERVGVPTRDADTKELPPWTALDADGYLLAYQESAAEQPNMARRAWLKCYRMLAAVERVVTNTDTLRISSPFTAKDYGDALVVAPEGFALVTQWSVGTNAWTGPESDVSLLPVPFKRAYDEKTRELVWGVHSTHESDPRGGARAPMDNWLSDIESLVPLEAAGKRVTLQPDALRGLVGLWFSLPGLVFSSSQLAEFTLDEAGADASGKVKDTGRPIKHRDVRDRCDARNVPLVLFNRAFCEALGVELEIERTVSVVCAPSLVTGSAARSDGVRVYYRDRLVRGGAAASPLLLFTIWSVRVPGATAHYVAAPMEALLTLLGAAVARSVLMHVFENAVGTARVGGVSLHEEATDATRTELGIYTSFFQASSATMPVKRSIAANMRHALAPYGIAPNADANPTFGTFVATQQLLRLAEAAVRASETKLADPRDAANTRLAGTQHALETYARAEGDSGPAAVMIGETTHAARSFTAGLIDMPDPESSYEALEVADAYRHESLLDPDVVYNVTEEEPVPLELSDPQTDDEFTRWEHSIRHSILDNPSNLAWAYARNSTVFLPVAYTALSHLLRDLKGELSDEDALAVPSGPEALAFANLGPKAAAPHGGAVAGIETRFAQRLWQAMQFNTLPRYFAYAQMTDLIELACDYSPYEYTGRSLDARLFGIAFGSITWLGEEDDGSSSDMEEPAAGDVYDDEDEDETKEKKETEHSREKEALRGKGARRRRGGDVVEGDDVSRFYDALSSLHTLVLSDLNESVQDLFYGYKLRLESSAKDLRARGDILDSTDAVTTANEAREAIRYNLLAAWGSTRSAVDRVSNAPARSRTGQPGGSLLTGVHEPLDLDDDAYTDALVPAYVSVRRLRWEREDRPDFARILDFNRQRIALARRFVALLTRDAGRLSEAARRNLRQVLAGGAAATTGEAKLREEEEEESREEEEEEKKEKATPKGKGAKTKAEEDAQARMRATAQFRARIDELAARGDVGTALSVYVSEIGAFITSSEDTLARLETAQVELDRAAAHGSGGGAGRGRITQKRRIKPQPVLPSESSSSTGGVGGGAGAGEDEELLPDFDPDL
jgi:hypothetical protein